MSIVFASPANATTIILSTNATETLGGLTFNNDDLAEYNPTTNTSTSYFDGDLFTGATDIDAVHILGNGNIILSTYESATLGGLTFDAGDLVEYNPTTDTATLYFEGSSFTGSENIDAVHVLDSGNIVLSTADVAILGGLSFTSGDLVEYNPTTDVATLYFDENNFTGSPNIDAVYVTTVPEPATIPLLGLGCLVLIGRKRG